MKKRLLTLLLALALLLGMGGCALPQEDGKFTIVTTTFAEYDWVRQILGNTVDAELILLTDNGTDLHSYQPTAQDIATIAQCELLIYTAAEQSGWLETALQTAPNPHRITLDLGEALADLALPEEHDHAHGDHSEEIDQHHWLSPKKALLLTQSIALALMEADPQHQEIYRRNADAYQKELAALDQRYQEAFAQGGALIFADRYPFRYMAEDYGLTCYAAFPGCSAEVSADFETVLFLAQKVQELQPAALLTVDGGNQALAQTIFAAADAEGTILSVASLQSVTDREIQEGLCYLAVMEQNLATFQKAINQGA